MLHSQETTAAMPTYAYRCTACEHRFEQAQRMTDPPLTECPACQGLIKRVIHPVGVVFKGSGWYINDSRKTESNGAKADDGGKTDADKNVAKQDKPDAGKPADAPKPAETAKAAKTESVKSSTAAD